LIVDTTEALINRIKANQTKLNPLDGKEGTEQEIERLKNAIEKVFAFGLLRRFNLYVSNNYFCLLILLMMLSRMKKMLDYNKNGIYSYGTVFMLSSHYSIKVPRLFHFCTRILSMIKSNIHNNSMKIGNH
jgi:hypothetical protein